MLRRCREICPFQIDCQQVRDSLIHIPEDAAEIETDLKQSLSVASEIHSANRNLGIGFSADDARNQIDEGLDLLNSVKAHREEIAETKRRPWVIEATSILATATCVGVVRGECSSPVGRYFERMESQEDTIPPPMHSEPE